jgi:glutathione S-transferase
MTNTMQTCMMRFFFPERYGGGEVERVAAAEAGRLFDLVEESLASRDWLVGEQRTAADLFLFMMTRWGRRLESPAWDRRRLRAHFQRTLALPGVSRMMSEQGLDLPDWAGMA